ncbi:MAG: BlaI/MecI/CopY family transcriptional regulator [Clostridiales bacterium]|jgi:BlaI family penicillinase repressor|nr:BlaI/MecI/CopY family transcriptional regulator [Clostridiales bacterium]
MKKGNLSKTELEAMAAIWRMGGGVTVQQVLGVFEESRGWKTSTMSTILSRLISKGFLRKARNGRANTYEPAISEDEYKRRETKEFITAVHHGDLKSFAVALAGDGEVGAEELSKLRKWLAEWTEETGKE